MSIAVEKVAEVAVRRLEAVTGKLDELTTYDFTKAVAQIKADVDVAKELIALIAGTKPKGPTYRVPLIEPPLGPEDV